MTSSGEGRSTFPARGRERDGPTWRPTFRVSPSAGGSAHLMAPVTVAAVGAPAGAHWGAGLQGRCWVPCGGRAPVFPMVLRPRAVWASGRVLGAAVGRFPVRKRLSGSFARSGAGSCLPLGRSSAPSSSAPGVNLCLCSARVSSDAGGYRLPPVTGPFGARRPDVEDAQLTRHFPCVCVWRRVEELRKAGKR